MTDNWDSLTWNQKCAADIDRAMAEDEAHNSRCSTRQPRRASHERIEGAQWRFA